MPLLDIHQPFSSHFVILMSIPYCCLIGHLRILWWYVTKKHSKSTLAYITRDFHLRFTVGKLLSFKFERINKQKAIIGESNAVSSGLHISLLKRQQWTWKHNIAFSPSGCQLYTLSPYLNSMFVTLCPGGLPPFCDNMKKCHGTIKPPYITVTFIKSTKTR